jgi:hypothetical protein
VDLLKGGQGVLNIVPLSGVLEELDAAILEIERGGARRTHSGPEPSASVPSAVGEARA